MAKPRKHDVLVIGSGAAGLSAALQLADRFHVAVLSKTDLTDGSTAWAQGGIAAVLDGADSFDAHVADTLVAGAGLCHIDTVRQVVEGAPRAVRRLIDLGVRFDTESDGQRLHLTREGGHANRRIVHSADATGLAVSQTLSAAVRRHPNIDKFEQRIAIDLIRAAKIDGGPDRCLGAWVLDRATGRVETFTAPVVILACGGASKVYLYTTNPDGATGDGIAMAWRAGCRVANMEFNQFHPTCLYHPHAKSFLISEAVRGEGALLRLPDGRRFLPDFDPRAELAPRDIVARAIDHEMKRLGIDCVYLDMTHLDPHVVEHHFPTIRSRCLEFDIDILQQPIPVVPAAHYTCGGIVVDRAGRTDLQGLYAIGEASFTGLHGANRLASNSLLECLVYAEAAASDIRAGGALPPLPADIPNWDESQVTDSDEAVVIAHNWEELRRFMWDYVGIVRTDKRLERAQRRIRLLRREISDYYSNFRVTSDLVELRNLSDVAELIIESAIRRRESRGLHFTLDCPDEDPVALDTVLSPATLARAG